MINLKFYPNSCIAVYTEAVAGKTDANLRDRLTLITPDITRCYNAYQKHFDKNELETLEADIVGTNNKKDLLSLYSFKRKVIRDLKTKIDETQINTISNTCQNCTINSVNTMDHVLGQALFPEYVVNPLNLFPSCGECNGYKGDTLVKDANRKFLNLYLDKLPEQQYLFVDIHRDRSDDLIWNFKIENRYGLDPGLFAIINNHYSSLYLPKRMRVKSVEFVTELTNLIKVRKANLSLDKIAEEVIQTANENRKIFGYNHFKYILEIALVESKEFMKIF